MAFKVNFAPPPKLLVRTIAQFPAQLLGTGGITITQSGGSVTIDGSAIAGGGVDEAVILLTDGPTVPLNAMLGNTFQLTAAGDRTILVPINAPVGVRTQKMIIHHKAFGGNRTLTLTTGSAGAFRFGSTIVGLTATLSGLTDWIGCLWNQLDARWDVVAYVKGY